MIRKRSLTAGIVMTVVATALSVAGGAVAAPGAKQTNTTFAGYLVSKPTGHVKSATATFVVPTITCKKNASGVGPAVLVQSAPNKKNVTTFLGGGIGVGCEHKQAVYESIIVVGGNSTNDLTLAAGDHVTVSVKAVKRKTKVVLDDTTSGGHKTRTGKGMVGATAFIGDSSLEIDNVGVGLDPFTKIPVTGALVNGKSLKAEHAARVTWVRHHTVLVTPSALHGGGKNFTLTFKHS
jgi:hypothetical protein